MKRLAIISLFVLASAISYAETEVVDGITWTYTVADSVASVGGGSPSSTAVPTNTSGAIAIPLTLGGYNVTSIGESAFYCCSGLMRVTIPDSVTSIGNQAFYNCSGFTSMTIPDGVMSIGQEAFYNCSGLTSVTIPASVTSIGSSAFSNCSRLITITVSDNNSTYQSVDGLLLNKSGTTLIQGVNGDVTIPNSVTNVGFSSFSGCIGLTSVTVPESVIGIESYAFYNCSGLTSVTIPDSVTSIGGRAFADCSGLEEMTLPFVGVRRGNSGSSDSVFGCIFGSSFYSSGTPTRQYYSSGSCRDYYIPSNLRKVVITDETVFGYGAFYGCSDLTSITIPNSVTSIDASAFSGCSDLTSITIPNSVTSIDASAFSGCSGLTSITIPNSVTNIDASAFSGCSGLKSITIPQYVSSRSLAAVFPDAYRSLESVVLQEGVTLVGDELFLGCTSLPSVTIPSSVTRLGDYVFKDCSALQSVTFDGSSPDIGTDIYDGTPRSLVTYVADGSIGWAGGISTTLPGEWNGRAISYVGGSGGGSGGSGGDSSSVVTTIVQQVESAYDLTDHAADRAIASVTVSADCAIDSFVLKDGKVYDAMLRIVNTASHDVKLTLPSGYVYETFEGVDPLTIPANSRNMLSITRTADRTFLVTREKLKTIE